MTDAQIFSWILLSVHEHGSTRQQISDMADCINHAVPTPDEMQTSLRWLKEHVFVREDGDKILLTESGAALVARVRHSTLMQPWDALSAAIQKILEINP